jgi:hypothetical protein
MTGVKMTDNPGTRPVHLLKKFRAFPGLRKISSATWDACSVRKFLEKVARNLYHISCPYKRTLTRTSNQCPDSKIVLALDVLNKHQKGELIIRSRRLTNE